MFVNGILNTANEHLFIELSVADLMWGYEDSLLKQLKDVLAKLRIKLPIDDRFGLFYKVRVCVCCVVYVCVHVCVCSLKAFAPNVHASRTFTSIPM